MTDYSNTFRDGERIPKSVVCLIGAMGGTDTRADARLIAAAPDLLATAKSARLMYYAWRDARLRLGLADDHEELNREIARIENAIAKAEGVEP